MDIKTVENFLEAADYKDISLYLLSRQEAKLLVEMLGSCQLIRHWETEGDFSLAGLCSLLVNYFFALYGSQECSGMSCTPQGGVGSGGCQFLLFPQLAFSSLLSK